MRSVKLLITLLLVTLSLSKGIAQSYVQPMRYDHYSFTQQVNIGVGTVRTTAPSAYLEVGPTSGATKGFLPPRLTTTQRDGISSPAAGLFIYNSTTNKYNYFNGVSWGEISNEYVDSLRLSGLNLQARKNGNWYTQFALTPYTDTIWREPGKDSIFWRKNGISYAIKDSGGVSMSQISDSLNGYWRQTGNNITYGKYIGTNNDFDLRFFTNGIQRGWFDSVGGFTVLMSDNRLSIGSTPEGYSLVNALTTDGSGGHVLNLNKYGTSVIVGNQTTTGGTFQVAGSSHLNGSVIINDSGADADVRIEGDTDPNLLFTDASTDAVLIGTTTVTDPALSSNSKFRVVSGTRSLSWTNYGGNDAILVNGIDGDNRLTIGTNTTSGSTISTFGATGDNHLTFGSGHGVSRLRLNDNGGLSFGSTYYTTSMGANKALFEDEVFIGTTTDAGNYKLQMKGGYYNNMRNYERFVLDSVQGFYGPSFEVKNFVETNYSNSFTTSAWGAEVIQNNAGAFYDARFLTRRYRPDYFSGLISQSYEDPATYPSFMYGTFPAWNGGGNYGGIYAYNGSIQRVLTIHPGTFNVIINSQTQTDAGQKFQVNGSSLLDGAVTINESGADADFRVEGDTDPNLLFTDASADEVRIGTSTDAGDYKLQVNGKQYISSALSIGTTSNDSTLHVVGGFKLVNGTQGAGKVLTSDANGGASWQTPSAGLTLDEGSYTPTLTNTTNIGSSTATTTHWFRVGDRIYVFGSIEIDATSAGTLSELGMTLPVGSTIGNESDLAGTAVHDDGTPIRICGDTVNNRAKFKFTPNTATANKYSFHFSYLYVAP